MRVRDDDDLMTSGPRPDIARIDLGLGLAFLAVAAWLWISGALAARAAIATYGRNVDSGVYGQALAVFAVLPIAALLLGAAWSNHRGGPLAKIAHIIAMIAAGGLVAIVGLIFLSSLQV